MSVPMKSWLCSGVVDDNTMSYIYRTKDLNGEENLVFSHIKAAGNEGRLRIPAHDVIAGGLLIWVLALAHSIPY